MNVLKKDDASIYKLIFLDLGISLDFDNEPERNEVAEKFKSVFTKDKFIDVVKSLKTDVISRGIMFAMGEKYYH